MTCSCEKTPGKPVPESIRVAVRGVERRIGARLDLESATALINYCGRNGCDTSSALRRALVVLDRSTTDPGDRMLADVIKALGLPGDASESDITNAVHALFADDAAPAGGDASAGNADPPAQPQLTKRALNRAEQAYCKRNNITPEEFAARCRAAAHTPPRKAK